MRLGRNLIRVFYFLQGIDDDPTADDSSAAVTEEMPLEGDDDTSCTEGRLEAAEAAWRVQRAAPFPPICSRVFLFIFVNI